MWSILSRPLGSMKIIYFKEEHKTIRLISFYNLVIRIFFHSKVSYPDGSYTIRNIAVHFEASECTCSEDLLKITLSKCLNEVNVLKR